MPTTNSDLFEMMGVAQRLAEATGTAAVLKRPPILTEIYLHRSGVGDDLILHRLPQIA